jgi:hypothetical protein
VINIIKFDFSARVLGKKDLLSHFDLDFIFFIPYGNHLARLGLFFGGLGDVEAAARPGIFIYYRSNQHPHSQGLHLQIAHFETPFDFEKFDVLVSRLKIDRITILSDAGSRPNVTLEKHKIPAQAAARGSQPMALSLSKTCPSPA